MVRMYTQLRGGRSGSGSSTGANPPAQSIGYAADDGDRPAAPSDGEMVFNEDRNSIDRWNQALGRWDSIGDIGVYPTVADLPAYMSKGDIAYVDADDRLYVLADDPASAGNLKWKAVGSSTPWAPAWDATTAKWPKGSIVFHSGKYWIAHNQDIGANKEPDTAGGAQWTDLLKWFQDENILSLPDLQDATVTNIAAGDTLQATLTGQWINTPGGYSKADVDAKVAALATGVSHGVAVKGIVDTPPGSPTAHEVVIVGKAPTGVFVGHVGKLASWDGAKWVFTDATQGEAHLNEADGLIWGFDTTNGWVKLGSAGTQFQKVTKTAYAALTPDPNICYLISGA